MLGNGFQCDVLLFGKCSIVYQVLGLLYPITYCRNTWKHLVVVLQADALDANIPVWLMPMDGKSETVAINFLEALNLPLVPPCRIKISLQQALMG